MPALTCEGCWDWGQARTHQRKGHGAGALQARRQHHSPLLAPKPALHAALPM